MKTKEEILQHHYVHDKGLNNPDYILNAMQEFSDQENAELRRELETLKAEVSAAKNIAIEHGEVTTRYEREVSELKEERDSLHQMVLDLTDGGMSTDELKKALEFKFNGYSRVTAEIMELKAREKELKRFIPSLIVCARDRMQYPDNCIKILNEIVLTTK